MESKYRYSDGIDSRSRVTTITIISLFIMTINHSFLIFKLELQVNSFSGSLLSVTSDDCVIWDIYTYQRKKSFFPKNTRFVNACLTSSGEHLLTYSLVIDCLP